MKSASMNAYFIALMAFKIQNLIIFKHPWFLPFFASSQKTALLWDLTVNRLSLFFPLLSY